MATGTSIGAMFVELGLKDTDFSKGLKAAEKSLTDFGKGATRVRAVMDKAIIGGFVAATAAVAGFTAASGKVGAEFQQALQTVGAIAGATGDQFGQLEGKARELGASTAFTATEAATAMQDFARAGLSVNQILNASGPAMLLAGSAGADMTQATTLLAATLAQFTLGASESTRVSDVFSTALRKSLFDMSSLTEAMKYAGTTGASFGMTLEQTTAAVAQFRNLGLEGSMAGTNFRMAMAAAAKPTEKAQQVLAKYNLTAADINPELRSFAEIMQAVGDASMTTSDALEVFGIRAGANVATIASEFAAGTSSFHDLLGELENSAGSTQALYDTMGDTVQFQSQILLSALQELMLQTFDTFKAPLQGLVTELGALVQYTAQVFAQESGSIASSMDGTLGGITDWLAQNREMLAVTFVKFAQGANQAVQVLATMVPLLTKLAGLMALVWVADKVRLFVVAVQAAVTNVGALSGSVRALTATLVASTGGIYALVAAIGTIVAGLMLYTSATNEAEAAAQRLRDAEAQLQADRDEREARQLAQAQQLVEGVNVRLGLVAQELQANDQLSDSLEAQLVALQSLTDQQVAAGLASGELFRATLAGQEVVLDHATALDLQYEGTVLAEDATLALAIAQRQVAADQRGVARELEELNAKIADYEQAMVNGLRETTAFNGTLRQYGDTIEAVRAKVQGLEEAAAELEATEAGLAEQRELAQQNLQRREVRAVVSARANADAQRAAAQATQEREAAEKALASAMQARLGAVEGILDELQAVGAGEEEQALLQFEQRLDALQATFAKEISAREAVGQEVETLVAEQQQAEAALYRLFQAQRLEQQRQEELQAAQALEQQLTSLREQETRRRATALQAIELDRLAALKAAEGAGAEQVAAINAVFDQRRLEHQQAVSQRVQEVIAGESEEVQELQRKADRAVLQGRQQRLQREADLARKREAIEADMAATLVELADATDDEKAQIREHFYAQMEQLDEDAQEAARARARQTLADIGRAALDAGRLVAQGMASLVSEVAGTLQSITGFSFNLFDAVGSVADQMQEVADLQEQLAAGEITQAEFDEAMADLPATAQEGARTFVQELLDGVLLTVQTFAAGAPVLVEELAQAIPAIVDALVQGLPAAVDALVEQLPTLMEALSDGVLQLVQLLADQMPSLIQALLDQLPLVIDTIGQAIPILLQALADGIAQVLAAIPAITEQLLAQLPIIIQALVAALDTIIIALVDAIPQLVAVVIEQLPSIVLALVEGILSLLDTIIVEVVGKLVPAIISMIPEIVTAVLESVVLLVQAVVEALPTLIEGLLAAVGEVVAAVLTMLPDLIVAVVELLPELIQAVVSLLPAIITGLVEGLPLLIQAVLQAIPEMVVALVTEAIPALIAAIPQIITALVTGLLGELPMMVGELFMQLFAGIGDLARAFLDAILGPLGDVFGKDGVISKAGSAIGDFFGSVGSAVKGLFSDTPGMQRMAGSGGLVGLAPDDYFIAAQRPEALLQQALQGVSVAGGEVALPGLQGVSQALMQVAGAMRAAGGPAGAAGSMQVTLRADGQVLDSVLFKAGRRGMTPHLENRARRSTVQAGVHPGFSRGDFNG